MGEANREQYLKDEGALDAYLTNLALDGAAINLSSGDSISGEVLERLIETYRGGRSVAEKLYRLYPYEALHGMLFVNPLVFNDLGNETPDAAVCF